MDIKNLKINDIIYNIATVWGKIKGNITDQTDLKNALDLKADTSDIPTDLSQLSNATTKFVNETELQNAISSLGSVLNLKGNVATVSDLPASNNEIGDVYYVVSVSAGYVWINDNGTLRWELLGMTVDTSNFLTKTGLLQTTGNATNNTMSQDAITNSLSNKQDTLVSGTNIKTINNTSILGSGNIDIQGGGNNYSTTEQVIGTWIDGKPLYRRVFNGTTSSNNTYITIDNILNLNVVNITGVISDGTMIDTINLGWDTSNRFVAQYNSSDGAVILTYSNIFKGKLYTLILEYTKTTDTI